MAVDEAILEAVGLNKAPATLRLYAWEPPCLSLGYAQPATDVYHNALVSRGWGLVRRPTGGRAILHTDELTYAVIAPHSEPRLAGGVLESYQRISVALLHALHLLGIPAEARATPLPIGLNGEEDNPSKGPVCFEAPSNYEITVNGKKLVGSAQARRKEGILQHGSLPLHGDLRRITLALTFPSPKERKAAAKRLLERATTVKYIFGRVIRWEEAAQAFIQAFKETLTLNLSSTDLSPAELSRASELVQEKYANPLWTERV